MVFTPDARPGRFPVLGYSWPNELFGIHMVVDIVEPRHQTGRDSSKKLLVCGVVVVDSDLMSLCRRLSLESQTRLLHLGEHTPHD